MRLEIMTKNYRIDDGMKELLTKKLGRFDKYFDDEAKAKVKLYTEGNNAFGMEITVSYEKLVVRSVASGDKMNEIIDVILPKLERQIIRHRDRFIAKAKKNAFCEPIYKEEEKEEKTPSVVKVKKFDVSVTTVENAIEEMGLLCHDFYVFINGETNKLCVLYKRNDGDLGLIEPEY